MAETTVSPIPQALRDSDVLLALGKAKACSELLIGLRNGAVTTETDDSKEWIEQIALEALEDALDKAEAEYLKCATAGKP
jgi:hypothetical protein